MVKGVAMPHVSSGTTAQATAAVQAPAPGRWGWLCGMGERVSGREMESGLWTTPVDNVRDSCGWLWKTWGQRAGAFTCDA
ncbi:hypothetical protein GCM10018965_068370 [Nonomuraea roseola]